MPSIHLRGLSFAHSTAVPVLDDVTLDLSTPPGAASWVGVVGANGAGKSTLLDLIGGHLRPTVGTLDVQASVAPLMVPQEVGEPTDDVLAFAASWDGASAKLRGRLELDPDDLDPALGLGWQALSPGQRKRWQVAAALASRPDVLLLDEPTNHLDVAARDLLLDTLRGFRGLGLVVSHDRTLLDLLTDRTLRLHRGGAALHAGSYTPAAARWRADDQRRREEHDRATREARRQRRILAEVRRDRHSAETAPRRERRLAGAKQPDAREAGRKLAQQKAEAALAARIGQMRSRVARADEDVDAIDVDRDHSGAVGFDHAASGRRVLVSVAGDVQHGGGEVWLAGVDVALHRGERVHLRGVNGAGKSTLIAALVAGLEATSETVATLPQVIAGPKAEVLAVRELDLATRGRVLGVVALLGVDPDRVLTTDDPSPGEARKLALARLLAGTASVVVLDEPTNHLDLPSIERLETALQGFSGALIMVTHDDALAAATTTTTWLVADRRVTVTAPPP